MNPEDEVWTLTPEQIRDMPMSEYAKVRDKLLGRAKKELSFREARGHFPDGAETEEMYAEEREEQERLALREQLRKAQEDELRTDRID